MSRPRAAPAAAQLAVGGVERRDAVGVGRLGLPSPVFDPQSWHALKLALVVRDESQIVGERVSGDPQVVRSDGLPDALQLRSDLGVPTRRLERQRQHL